MPPPIAQLLSSARLTLRGAAKRAGLSAVYRAETQQMTLTDGAGAEVAVVSLAVWWHPANRHGRTVVYWFHGNPFRSADVLVQTALRHFPYTIQRVA